MKMRKQTFVIIILIILLVVAAGYIVYTKFQASQQQKMLSVAQFGYQQAIIEIMEQALKCEQVPLYAGNDTLNIVAVECLQQTLSRGNNTG